MTFRVIWRVFVCYQVAAFCMGSALADVASTATMYQDLKRHYQASQAYTIRKQYNRAQQELQKGLQLLDRLSRRETTPKGTSRVRGARRVFLYARGRIFQLDRKWGLACLAYRRCLQLGAFPKARHNLQSMLRKRRVGVLVRSVPTGARVVLSGGCLLSPIRGKTPLEKQVLPGSYQLQLDAQGHKALRETLVLKRATNLRLSLQPLPTKRRTPQLPRTQPRTRPAAVVGTVVLGVGLAAVATGLVFLGVSVADQMTYEEFKGNPAEETRVLEALERGSALRVGSFVVGGVGLAMTMGGWLMMRAGATPVRRQQASSVSSPKTHLLFGRKGDVRDRNP